jgi:hypothetical protein
VTIGMDWAFKARGAGKRCEPGGSWATFTASTQSLVIWQQQQQCLGTDQKCSLRPHLRPKSKSAFRPDPRYWGKSEKH